MPTINVLFKDLESLIGDNLPRNIDKLTSLLTFVKGEVASFEGEELSIEIKDGNRPDLWGIEGIARALRGALNLEEGLKKYMVEASSGVEIKVDPRLHEIRPYIACAIVKDVHLTDEMIRGFMHLQDKLDQTYGRKRRRTSIGLYNFSLINAPLRYTVVKPTEISFIPLESSRKMNLNEIIEYHPKGLEYGHIVKSYKEWPILLDAKGSILSFPPIINSSNVGKITEDTTHILIEVTGTVHQTVLNTLVLVALSVADRGGKILTTTVNYPYTELQNEETPNLLPSTLKLELELISDVLGIILDQEDVINLLKRARYDAFVDGKSLIVKVPCYRFDIMHPIDIIEDIAILYGYNNIKPRWPQLITFGNISSSELISDSVREVIIGLGFQEILSFSMTCPQNLFNKMNIKPEQVVEIANPINERFTCLRSWLIPSLMDFLSHNTHVSYPQKIFEVGDCTVIDRSSKTGVIDVKKLACLSIHSRANFNEIKAALNAFFITFGKSYDLYETSCGAFIEGRVGNIILDDKKIGFIGEINPKVLEEYGLEYPTVGFEVDLSKLFHSKG